MSVKTVVVGFGGAGRRFHCYLIGLAEGLELYGVVSSGDQKRRRVEADLGCKAFPTLADALGDAAVELIVLATPNATHAELAVQALEAGRNVVTDKVMCLDLEQFGRMEAAARRSGKLLTVFQNRRFDGDYLTVRKLMADGTLGEVKWIEVAWMGHRAMRGWRGRAEMGGGRYYDLGAHLVDQLCMLLPAPLETVHCRMLRDYDDSDTESEALLTVTFAGGATGVCDLSGRAFIPKPRWYVRGAKGTYVKHGLDPQEAAMHAGDIDAAQEDPADYGTCRTADGTWREPTVRGRWRDYYENIAAVLNDGAAPAVTLPELRRQITVLDAGLRSGRTGDVIRIESE